MGVEIAMDRSLMIVLVLIAFTATAFVYLLLAPKSFEVSECEKVNQTIDVCEIRQFGMAGFATIWGKGNDSYCEIIISKNIEVGSWWYSYVLAHEQAHCRHAYEGKDYGLLEEPIAYMEGFLR